MNFREHLKIIIKNCWWGKKQFNSDINIKTLQLHTPNLKLLKYLIPELILLNINSTTKIPF